MKKLFVLLIVVTLLGVSCKGPEGAPGKNPERFIVEYEVFSKDWKVVYEKDWYFFECELRFPELTNAIFTEGVVICYLAQDVTYDGGRSYTRVNSLMPYTVYGEYEDDGYLFPYSENYSVEIRPGYINFTVKYSDFAPDYLPPDRRFHVVMFW